MSGEPGNQRRRSTSAIGMSTEQTNAILAQAKAANAGVRNFANASNGSAGFGSVAQQVQPFGGHDGRRNGAVGQRPPPQHVPIQTYGGGGLAYDHRWPPDTTHSRTASLPPPQSSLYPVMPLVSRQLGQQSVLPATGMRQRAAHGNMFVPEARSHGPVNHAVALLQGSHTEADVKSLEDCLFRMGFSQPVIHWEPKNLIDRQTAESAIVPLVETLNPGSNLLLIVAAKGFNGIALDKEFLMENVYNKVAVKNAKLAQQRDSETKRAEDSELRQLDPITLHAVLDGVEGCVLPHAMVFAPERGAEDKGLRAQWADIPQTKQSAQLSGSMATGRLIQICSTSKLLQHAPGTLLSAFINANLIEAYLPFNVLAFRMLNLMRHEFRFDSRSKKHDDKDTATCCGVRCGAELVAGPVLDIAHIGIQMLQARHQRIKQEKKDMMLLEGDLIFTSANCFDSNLCFDVCWNDSLIPMPAI